jgi:hypothetical protein
MYFSCAFISRREIVGRLLLFDRSLSIGTTARVKESVFFSEEKNQKTFDICLVFLL